MKEEELTALLDRAAGSGRLDEDFVTRSAARGRAMVLRRRLAAVAVAVVVAATAGYVLLPGPSPERTVVAVTPAPGVPLDRFEREAHRAGGDVLVAGATRTEEVVVVRRRANETEEHLGGSAAEVWMSTDAKPFERISDYVSFDFSCDAIDSVCMELKGELGFFAVIRTGSGTALAVLRLPEGRSAVLTTTSPWKIKATVTLADGREYGLPLPPGGVIAPGR